MGYELEVIRAGGVETSWLDRKLAQRWERADERLHAAIRACALARRNSAPGEPRWLEAQIMLAEARLRWRECAEEAERLAELADGPELFR
jgi:hypothetical protein